MHCTTQKHSRTNIERQRISFFEKIECSISRSGGPLGFCGADAFASLVARHGAAKGPRRPPGGGGCAHGCTPAKQTSVTNCQIDRHEWSRMVTTCHEFHPAQCLVSILASKQFFIQPNDAPAFSTFCSTSCSFPFLSSMRRRRLFLFPLQSNVQHLRI